MPFYTWQEPYLSVSRETEESKRHARILETRSAFEQRLLSPVGDDELRAMEAAVATLNLLEGKPHDATHISDTASQRGRKNPRSRNPDI
jgi:hypothetical protein